MSERDRSESEFPPTPPPWLAIPRYTRNARAREDRPASGAQLYRLNALGMLTLRDAESDSILAVAAHRLLARLKEQGRW